MKSRILTFGEVLWDVIEGREYIGGAPFNLAGHLARLGVQSLLITRVGADQRGRDAIEAMGRTGVDTTLVQTDPAHPTGIVEVELSEGGVPSYILHQDVAYDFVSFSEELREMLKSRTFDVFCFGTLAQRTQGNRETLYRVLKELQASHVFLDINLRQPYYDAEVVRSSLTHASILKLNDTEVDELSHMIYNQPLTEKEFVKAVSQDFSIHTVCITKGEKGCAAYHEDECQHIPGIKVAVADTVGAGDAFSAAFLYKFCESGDPFESARFGNYLGAYVASRNGAVPEYSDEVKEFLGVTGE